MITYHADLVQGSEEWLAERCGMLTASEMHLIVTPTLKAASNDKERTHLYELLAQRITGYVEPQYISDDMLRGMDEEITALDMYAKHHSKIEHVGFVTNDKWGFTIGYSPDAIVGKNGLVECKSRRQKYQIQTIVDGVVPPEYMIQIQTGLLVSEREWLDFISYSGGLPMFLMRCYPMPEYQEAIVKAATAFEEIISNRLEKYRLFSKDYIPTERKIIQEIY